MAKSLKGVSIETLNATRKAFVRKTLRKEFTDFFTTMTSSTDRWPDISDTELIDAIADSLITMGERRKMGAAMLQTLVYELQDRTDKY